MTVRSCLSALALSAGVCSVAMADLTGKITLDGKAPEPKEISMKAVPDCAKQHKDPVYDESIVAGEKGELKNVVIYIKEGPGLSTELPKTPAVLDQKGCVYSPHVLPMMAGQEFQVTNSDPFLHNVHGLAKDNGEFNFPQQTKGDKKKVDNNKSVENYKVKCDVHPWMSAWIVVLENPHFATSGEDGAFKIPGLKTGQYKVIAWHERLGTQEAMVDVKDGNGTVDFKFKPKRSAAAADAPAPTKEVLVSMPANEQCEECNKCDKPEKTTPVATK